MAKKNVIRTSKKEASNAGKLLSSKNAAKKVKGVMWKN